MKTFNKTLIAAAMLSTQAFAAPTITVPAASVNNNDGDMHAMFKIITPSNSNADDKSANSDIGVSGDITSTTTFYGPGNVVVGKKTTTFSDDGSASATGDGSAGGPSNGMKASVALTTGPFGTSSSSQGVATPASVACMYGYTAQTANCNPQVVTANVAPNLKATRVIAVVDAYYYKNALSDLQVFSKTFNLPAPNLSIIYAAGKQPTTSQDGWDLESALDLQWAHAMAPNAKIIQVQAASNTMSDMLLAIQVATKAVQAAGGGVVSMSFGSDDFTNSQQYDSYFNNAGVIYYAASGDHDIANWPCVSQYVVCVGGTSVRATGIQSSTRNVGDFEQEVPWIGTGAGTSLYVAKPAYQGTNVAGNFRGVPDIALAADTMVGAWVYMTDADFDGWTQVEGTSWATPMAAGITANSNTASTTSVQELTKLYAGKSTYFTDISTGYCGLDYGIGATVGWDNCTGLGSFYNYK